MNEIPIKWFSDGKPYETSTRKYNNDLLDTIYIQLQERFFKFSEKINKNNGYIKVKISPNIDMPPNIITVSELEGLPEILKAEILSKLSMPE